MDCTPIFEPEFDMKAWLNAAFAAGAADESLDDAETANRLLAKLQSYQQEVGSLLEESWTAAVTAVPRAAREMASVKQEALLLQDQLRSVKSQLERVEQETSASMSKLVQADQLKSRLQRARGALREADNWTTLSTNIDELLDSADLAATGERLAQLAQSLSMLDSSPDYAARRQQLESWRNQFEAQLAVHVYRAFAVRDTAECARLVGLLGRIDRPTAANAHYQRWLTGHLAEAWSTAVTEASAGRSGGESAEGKDATSAAADVAESALDALLDACRRELRAALLPDCSALVLACLARSLPGLRPPLSEVLRPLPSLDLHANLRRLALLCRTAAELSALFAPQQQQQQQSALSDALLALLRPSGPAILADLEAAGTDQLSRDLAAIPMDQSEVDDTLSLLENATPLALAAARRLLTACAASAPLSVPRLSRLLPAHLARYLAELGRVLGNVRAKLPDPTDEWAAVGCIMRCGCLLGRLVDQAAEFADEFPDLLDSGAFLRTGDWAPEIYGDAVEGEFDRRLLRDLTSSLSDGRPPGWVRDMRTACQEFCAQEHRHLFALLTKPIDRLLAALPGLPCWTPGPIALAAAQNLPSFGYLASECVAQVGQYLLHLPQQLGPFLSADTPGLRSAVMHSGLMQLLHHHRQHQQLGTSGEQSVAGAELWIECVASHAMDRYVDKALEIPTLASQSAVQQLLTDANYLASCLDDLGVTSTDRLQALRDLVAATDAEAFHRRAAEGAPRRLVNAVAKMRDFTTAA